MLYFLCNLIYLCSHACEGFYNVCINVGICRSLLDYMVISIYLSSCAYEEFFNVYTTVGIWGHLLDHMIIFCSLVIKIYDKQNMRSHRTRSNLITLLESEGMYFYIYIFFGYPQNLRQGLSL